MNYLGRTQNRTLRRHEEHGETEIVTGIYTTAVSNAARALEGVFGRSRSKWKMGKNTV